MSILFHGQVRILRQIKKSFPVINIHNVKINLFSFPPKTKQFSLHLCPCISKDLSLGRFLATVSEYYATHILPHAIKISLKSHHYHTTVQGQNKARKRDYCNND